jgi:hypothetical protein
MKYIVRLFVLFSFLISSNVWAELTDASMLEKEYTMLEALRKEGAFNADLFLRLAELSPEPAKSLAYLRQAQYLAPGKVSIHKISTLRSLLKTSTASLHSNHNQTWWHNLLLSRYIPQYCIDYLLIIVSLAGTLVISVSFYRRSNAWKYSGTLLFTLLLILFIQRFLLIQDGSPSVRFIGSMQDLYTREGVVLEKLNAFAAPSTSSHETMILSPGSEVLIVQETPKKDWTLVKEIGGRKGWVKDTSNIFILKK